MTRQPTTVDDIPELAGLRRPRWRVECPILWRDATTITLGDRAIVTDVTALDADWLTGLDGLRETGQIVDELPLEVARARRLLRAARGVPAIEDAAQVPDSIRWATASARPAAWARLGAAIDTLGSIPAAYAAVAARAGAAVGVVGDEPVATPTRAAFDQAGLRLVDGPSATFTVLAQVGQPEATGIAPEVEGPHLPVVVWGRRAVVGPVVDPGRSSCLRCAQLHRRDADPAWPLLAVQWAHAVRAMRTPPVDPLLAVLAASTAAAMARAWVDDPGRTHTDHAIEIVLPTARATVLPRPIHPLCGCTWAQAD